ncbi:gliding motility-associated C-terminal domain-containing protein [Flavobacteriales bacterium]|nr:gliding motility-associated C-terminal domain-containing protein [Flavobacteriales bacterium]
MKNITFSIACLFLYIPLFAQDCNEVTLNLVSTNECLPIVKCKLKGTVPSESEVNWSLSNSEGISLSIRDNNLVAVARIKTAGEYEISMNVTLPNGEQCTKSYKKEVLRQPELKTNIKSEYKLCNGFNSSTLSILNPEEFKSMAWIIENKYYRQTDLKIDFDEVGTKRVIIQATDTTGCFVRYQKDIEIVDGPNANNVKAELNASINDLNCLEIGSKYTLTTEITSIDPVKSVYWRDLDMISGTDRSFEVTVNPNQKLKYPLTLIYDECQVDIDIDHSYSLAYSTNISNPYQGSELCKGESITLENSTPFAEGLNDFTWSIEDAQIISESPEKITFFYDRPGTYNWQLNYNGECPSNAKKTLKVNLADRNQHPQISINSDDLSACQTPFDLYLNTSNDFPTAGNLSYHWSLNKVQGNATHLNTETFEYQIEKPGNYQLIVVATNDALICTAKDTIFISVDHLNLDLQLTTSSECSGYEFKPMDFATNQLDESVIYNWEMISDASVIGNSALESPTFIMEEPGVYDLSLNLYSTINRNCEKTISEKKLITINKNPELKLSTEKLDVCTFPYQATIEDLSTFDDDYSWILLDDTDLLSSGRNKEFSYTFNDPGAYRLRWSNENTTTECRTVQEVLIHLDDLQIDLDDSEPFVSHCIPFEFDPKTINQTETLNGHYTYKWELINSKGEIYQTRMDTDGDFVVEEAGIYDLRLSLSNEDGSCFDQVKLDDFVSVYSYDLKIGVLESSICFDEGNNTIEKTFYARFNAPPSLITNHIWEINSSSGVQILTNTSDSLKLALTEAGNYTVTYSTYIENSDCIFSRTLNFAVGATAQISTPPVICLDKMFPMEDNPNMAVGTNTIFTWSSPDEELKISNPHESHAMISASKAGNYLLELTVQNNFGCTGSTSLYIEAYELDALFSSPNAGEQCKPAIVNLNSENNEYITSYTWNLHETNLQGVKSSTTFNTLEPNLETLLNEIADYDVELIIGSTHGCMDTAKVEDYINLISPRPYFTVTEKMVCDTLELELNDESKFIDDFYIDYGNNTQTNYILNQTNKVSYTYPEGEKEPTVEFEISLIGDYASCIDSFKYTVKMEQPSSTEAPEIRYVSVRSNDKVHIQWSSPNLGDSFNATLLYHHTSDNAPSLIESSPQINRNHFTHQTPTNTVNHYSISLEDTCKRVSNYSTKHATILLETKTASFETIELNWTPYTGWEQVKSYTIFRSVDGGDYELLKELPGNQLKYTDNFLCDVNYGYYIFANHPSKDYKSRSNSSLIKPKYVEYSTPLELISSSVYLDSSIISNWETHSDYKSSSSSYLIDRWDSYFGWITHYGERTEPPFIDQNVGVNHANYRYRVKYTDKCGNIGPLSNYGENIVLTGVQHPSHFELNWNPYGEWESGVEKYTIQYYNVSKNKFEDITHITDTQYIDHQLNKKGLEEKYCFRVVATKAENTMTKSISNAICFTPAPKDYFPNAFTPNKDGVNETYSYQGSFAKALKTKIYSRWGTLVYESEEVEFKWDGKHQKTGEICANGRYFFHYELTGFDGTVIKNNKLIFLVR